MFEVAGCTILLVHPDCVELADQVLSDVHRHVTIVIPEQSDVVALTARWPRFRVLGARDLEPAHACAPPANIAPDTIANLLFTSGSTGVPKGVMVTHANVVRFIDVMCQRYDLSEQDRFSQTFPLVFDLAGFDMFMAWEVGGCICCPSPGELVMPGAYICAARITVWFSVPSLALHMKRCDTLQPDLYPALRYSLFCGEALPAEVLDTWAKAAPNSILENLYGPTELTLACTLYRWDCQHSPAECEQGVVPIGHPYPGMKYLVVDESFHEVPPGETGQLLLTGPQRTLGYWNDPEKTAAAFVIPPGRDETYYCTGDRVRRPYPGRPLTYLGRLDFQINVQGLRVELGEVEAALRDLAGVDVAIAVGWPPTPGGADGIVAFLRVDEVDIGALAKRLRERLPREMIPKRVIAVAEFPLNANGKIDRKVLDALARRRARGLNCRTGMCFELHHHFAGISKWPEAISTRASSELRGCRHPRIPAERHDAVPADPRHAPVALGPTGDERAQLHGSIPARASRRERLRRGGSVGDGVRRYERGRVAPSRCRFRARVAGFAPAEDRQAALGREEPERHVSRARHRPAVRRSRPVRLARPPPARCRVLHQGDLRRDGKSTPSSSTSTSDGSRLRSRPSRTRGSTRTAVPRRSRRRGRTTW